MDLDDLKLFMRIAQLRSISAAARDQSLTPAGASARLAAFEKRLGARLLHRTTRQAALTVDGLAFLPHAENVLAAADAARAVLGREQAAPRGTLRVAAPASFARMHIVPGLRDFCARYPDLALDFRISDSVVDLVEGAFDVAVRYTELGDSSFIARRLAPDRRILVASPEYLEQRGRPNTPDDLTEHTCLVVGTLDLWTFWTRSGSQSNEKSRRRCVSMMERRCGMQPAPGSALRGWRPGAPPTSFEAALLCQHFPNFRWPPRRRYGHSTRVRESLRRR